MSSAQVDELVSLVLSQYYELNFRIPDEQVTVLASFLLSAPETSHLFVNSETDIRTVERRKLLVISLATGTKCLPTCRFPVSGDALHDSHAEVLARRGAVRWLLEEVCRCAECNNAESPPYESSWIEKVDPKLGYRLRDGVKVHLYISTVPCGDASTRFLAAFQDPYMAALKDSSFSLPQHIQPNLPDLLYHATRGRNNYSLFSILRTKPGRPDSPVTTCLSCSDKIALWSVVGIQGALGCKGVLCEPVYVDEIIIGGVYGDEMKEIVVQDCIRACWGRVLSGIDGNLLGELLPKYKLNKPKITFTSVSFPHSYSPCSPLSNTTTGRSSCNESLCWVLDLDQRRTSYEVLINGMKRGVAPKHRHRDKSRPMLSKLSYFQLYCRARKALGQIDGDADQTYYEAKRSSSAYQAAKEALLGDGRPFSGWIRSGIKWENFTVEGLVKSSNTPNVE